MELDIELIKRLTQTPGVPGYEDSIREAIIEEITPFTDSVEVDNMGNVIAVKKGFSDTEKRVMVDAHMDEIGFMVTHIDANGFLKLHALGGFDPKTLTSQRVIVHGKKDLPGVLGSKPIHEMSAGERGKAPAMESYFVDLGLPKEEVVKFVYPGAVISRVGEVLELGNCIASKSMDNRICVYVLIETLKQLEETPYDVYATFTVQEEVGLRGAELVSKQVAPDFALCLDVTIGNNTPGTSEDKRVTALGEGAAVKIVDGGILCDARMIEFLKYTAERNEIKSQTEILTLRGKTNTAFMQRSTPGGAVAGAVSVPLRYLHQTIETAHKDDIKACIALLTASLETMDKYHWER